MARQHKAIADKSEEMLDLGKCQLVPRDPATVEYIIACGSPEYLKLNALETLDKMAALKRRGLSICEMCANGHEPEWSHFAEVWIHRHDRLDRRCYERQGRGDFV